MKEFCANTDTDGSLSVDLSELNTFFSKFVDHANKSVNLKMADGMSPTKKVKPGGKSYMMKVLNDF